MSNESRCIACRRIRTAIAGEVSATRGAISSCDSDDVSVVQSGSAHRHTA